MITINLLRDWQKYDESFPHEILNTNGVALHAFIKDNPEVFSWFDKTTKNSNIKER